MSLTLRDEFAIAALTALANTGRLVNAAGVDIKADNPDLRKFAADVWRLADLMVEERGSVTIGAL